MVEKYGLQKTTLLREISIKTGIQVICVHSSDGTTTVTTSPNEQQFSCLEFLFSVPVDPHKGV